MFRVLQSEKVIHRDWKKDHICRHLGPLAICVETELLTLSPIKRTSKMTTHPAKTKKQVVQAGFIPLQPNWK